MEDIISAVGRGCRLAHALESDLDRLNGAAQLLEKCEEIAAVFTAAIHRLRAVNCHVALYDSEQRNYQLVGPPREDEGTGMETGTRMRKDTGGVGPVPSSGKGKEVIFMEQVLPYGEPGGSGGGGAGVVEGGGELRLPTYVKSGGGGGGASGCSGGESLQKSRKRKDETGKRTIEVSAPLHGNTEIPPDDGYTWRKYGQKEILGAQYPRGYYRCTHQKLYNCPAKKQVQRLNNNPRIFQVAYRGDHTCHMSSTAPASAFPPPAPPPATADTTDLARSLPSWFPVELTSQYLMGMSSMSTSSMVTAMTMPFLDPNNFNTYGAQVTDTNVVGIGSGGGEGPTSSNVVVVAGQGDQYHGANVVDMADAMFNPSTGGGVDHSIDFIFSQWEPSESKN